MNIHLDTLRIQCNDTHFDSCHAGIASDPYITLIEDTVKERYFLRIAVYSVGQEFYESGIVLFFYATFHILYLYKNHF